ncbi:nucleolar complex protein 3 like protein [Quercus suber]|uniref:Nucleolar complex protein 3 like protein n=1 Tax=Quercus suber TaxID=58331 RepID=A0AAW0LHL2_QUESU
MGRKKSEKIILPPELRRRYLTTKSKSPTRTYSSSNTIAITLSDFPASTPNLSPSPHVTRVADAKEDALEAFYEKRLKKKALQKEKEESGGQIDPVVALPVKTLDGKLYYRTQLGMALLANPEPNIKSLEEMLQISKDNDHAIAVLSMLAVFKDIIPGYRIRLPTEKELEMKVSKDVKNMRFNESTLLSAQDSDMKLYRTAITKFNTNYKQESLLMLGGFIQDTIRWAYLQWLIMLEKKPSFQHVAVHCICTLLDAVPHFNFQEILVGVIVRNIGSSDDVTRLFCPWDATCFILEKSSLKSLWNEKDADGNTVLHHHSNSSKLIPQVMNDLRLDKMAFNKQNLDAFDVTLTSEETGIGKWPHSLQLHVTFAAVMTVPGGFVSGQDADAVSAILRTNVAFKAFIISNSIAMVLSTISALLQLFWHSVLLAFNLTVLALIAMMLAFFTGIFCVRDSL